MGARAKPSTTYVLSVLDDQAPRWSQVAPKSSHDSPMMAPAWPQMIPSCTQVLALFNRQESVFVAEASRESECCISIRYVCSVLGALSLHKLSARAMLAFQ